MSLRFGISVVALLGLTACGGGGGTLGGGAAANFAALDAEYDSLLAGIPGEAYSPASGTVFYDGVILVVDPGSGDTLGYLGDVAASMNFTSSEFRGSATNFLYVSIDGTPSPTGLNTTFAPNDGSVSSNNVEFNDLSVTSADFSPEFSGTINGLAITGTGRGTLRGAGARGFTIFEDCITCDVELDGVATEVTVIGLE